MNFTKTLAVLGVVLGIVAVGLVTTKPGQTAVQQLGALSSPDIPSPYFSFGGVRHWGGSTALQTATTTVCAIQSPAATSTLEFAGIRFDVSSTTASIVTIAKASTAFATTTKFGDEITIAANAEDTIVASSTALNIENEDHIFGPNEYLVVGMKGNVGTFSPTGLCQATWKSL